MSKTILTLLMAAMSTGAMAEWVHIWESDLLTAYVDPGSVRQKGNNVVIQSMFDHKRVLEYDGNEYRSMVVRFEFNCDKERARSLDSIFYAERKGSGTIVDSGSTPYDWRPVPPATPLASFMKYACDKDNLK